MIPPVDIYDNEGKSFDQYTVFFPSDDLMALAIGKTGNVPNGFCQWTEALNPKVWGEKYLIGLGKKINFEDCPDPVQRAIKNEWSMQ